jgi:hypothetical protein
MTRIGTNYLITCELQPITSAEGGVEASYGSGARHSSSGTGVRRSTCSAMLPMITRVSPVRL